MFEWQQKTKAGMLQMVSENREYIEATHNTLRHIHGIYISTNSHLYTKNELSWINHFLDSIIHKSFLTRIAVEQLQAVRHGKLNEALWPAIENSLETLNCSDDEQILVSFALEIFLFEARSFLDVYMLFVSLLLKTGLTKEYMSTSRFFDELSNAELSEKAQWTRQYFETKVFGLEENPESSIFRNDWGTLLRNLRDKIAHRDVINLSFDSKEKFIHDIKLDWPTLKGMTYHSLTETIGNGMHSLFNSNLSYIYELKWDDYQKKAKNS